MDSSPIQFRCMILYDFQRGLQVKESHENLVKAWGDAAPSLSTIRYWYHQFEHGRTSVEDEPRSGRPVEAVTPENIARVAELVKEHRNITVREIEGELGISLASIETILHQHLCVRKLASRWIPHLLTVEQKQARMDWCQFMLEKFKGGRSKRVAEIVTGDETWIYSYDPETKQQSTVWVFEDEPPPTKVVRSRSVAKQMVAVFFRRQGLVAAVPLEKGRTVTAQWYCDVCLPSAFEKLENERPSAGLRGILLHHDNAPAHTAARTLDVLHEQGVRLVTHPPYSPDLAPCDFYLFPKLKHHLRGTRFEDENAAVTEMSRILEDMPKSEFQDCF